MGIKEKTAILIMAFFSFCVPASLSPLGEFSLLDHLQGNMKNKAVGVHLSNNYRGGTGIAHPNKFSHASSSRGGSRPAIVRGGNPSGGESHSPHMQGGSAVIPLYAAGASAGAANNHHNYHRNNSGSKCNYSCVELVTFALTILTCLLLREDM
ncbi:hypothetical protein Pfo_027285 [Paulownia fortunei]|nr:hypothetical protein Pfo_027285 [Paulownia fortunei]